MVDKKNNLLKNNKPYPLKKILIAFSILLVVSLGVNEFARSILFDSLAVFRLPNSEHSQDNPIQKKETVTVTTDTNGYAESASSSVYITNNKEKDVLIDQSSLTNIQSSASDIVRPKYNKKTDELSWTLNKKDVSYTGYAEPNEIPVKMNVNYYLDGKKINGEDLAGKTGKLKIDIKYTSTQTVNVDNRASKVPYVTASVVTFDNSAKKVKVKGGSVVKSKGLSIAAGLAFPGWEEVLGKSGAEGLFNNRIVITADVKNMTSTQIISMVSPDLFEDLTNENLDAINADNVMTLVESYTKASVAAAQNVSKALIVADTKVMPMVKSTTSKLSDISANIVKAIPEFYKSSRDTIGKLQATTNIYFYFTSQLKNVIAGEEAYLSKVRMLDENLETYLVTLRALYPGTEANKTAYDRVVRTINKQYGETIGNLSQTLVQLCAASTTEKYNEALATINKANYGDNSEKIAYLAKLYSYEPINLDDTTQFKLLVDACGQEKADSIRNDVKAEKADAREEIAKLLISLTDKGGDYADAMSDKEKLDKINEMLIDEDWLKNAVESGEIDQWMDDQGMDADEKALYREYIKKLIDEGGELPSMEEMSKATPREVTDLYKNLNKVFDEKNQKSVTNTAAQISKGIKAIDDLTGKIGVSVHKISNVANKITVKLTKAYNGAISKVFKMYNKNIRGLTENLKKIKKVDEKAGVFSGMTDEMQGSSTFMFYTPVASKQVNVNEDITEK